MGSAGGGSASGNTGLGSWLPHIVNPQKWGISPSAAAARDSKIATEGATRIQREQSDAIKQQILTAPKVTPPDNFLANKNKMLMNMRLGLASTISGAGTAANASLVAPALSAVGGKSKLGQ